MTTYSSDGTILSWFASTEREGWRDVSKENRSSMLSGDVVAARIEWEKPQQAIEGFGGCFNEMGWEALQAALEAERTKVLRQLFHQDEGCRFNICRMPIGASDYAVDWYSFDEAADDFEMKYFNIERDKLRLIPYIKAAQTFNPNLKIWASPWCPPSWMKTNGHYACEASANLNGLPSQLQVVEGTTSFRMLDGVLKAYARYFTRFVDAYRNEGIEVFAVHVQNEPLAVQKFPSCVWRAEDLALLISKYLGPQFETEKKTTEIWLGTINSDDYRYVETALGCEHAARYIKGVGLQWAGKEAIPEIHRRHPDLNLAQTENECGDGSNDWAALEHSFGLVKHYLKHGARSYMYWNMVLDESGLSRWGWKQNAMISISKELGTARFNPEFYLMKHLGHFVTPGSRYVPVASEFDDIIGFVDPSQRLVLVGLNKWNQPRTLYLQGLRAEIRISMEPASLHTIVIDMKTRV